MKNIWKFMMIAVMAIAMVGCPDPNNGNGNNGGKKTSNKKIYVAGINNKWAADNAKGDAVEMKTTDGKIYTVTVKADGTTPTPYGIKFCTGKGWAEQYVLKSALPGNEGYSKTEKIKYVLSDETCDFVFATKAQLEAKDASGDGLVVDNNTKMYIKYFVADQADITITFDLENLIGSITYAAKDNPPIEVTSIMIDGLTPYINSNVGNVALELDEDNSDTDNGLYIFTAKLTYTDPADWGVADAICLGITEGEGIWSQKFTGANFEIGTSVSADCIYNADNNNTITGMAADDEIDVTVTVQATASGLWSDCSVSFTAAVAN